METLQAEDYQRFQKIHQAELQALKSPDHSFVDDQIENVYPPTTCYRGHEKHLLESPRLRTVSRVMFVQKVLNEQDYQHMKTNADSCAADRLAAKVSRWTMGEVDKAILRAQVGMENTSWNRQDSFSTLVMESQCIQSSTKSTSYHERFMHAPFGMQPAETSFPSLMKENKVQRLLTLSLIEVWRFHSGVLQLVLPALTCLATTIGLANRLFGCFCHPCHDPNHPNKAYSKTMRRR